MPADVALPVLAGPVRRGPLRSFLADFFKNRAALLGIVLLGLLVFGAVFADFIAPYSPIEQYRDFIRAPPSWQTGGFCSGTSSAPRCGEWPIHSASSCSAYSSSSPPSSSRCTASSGGAG